MPYAVILLHSHSTVFEQPKYQLWIWNSFWGNTMTNKLSHRNSYSECEQNFKLKLFHAEFGEIVFQKHFLIFNCLKIFFKILFESSCFGWNKHTTTTKTLTQLTVWKKMRIGFTSKKKSLWLIGKYFLVDWHSSVIGVNCTELKWSNNWPTEVISKPTDATV